jgi:hypothetical protein
VVGEEARLQSHGEVMTAEEPLAVGGERQGHRVVWSGHGRALCSVLHQAYAEGAMFTPSNTRLLQNRDRLNER